MSSQKESKPPHIARLLREMQTDEALRHQAVAARGLDPQIARLRSWQSERLARTYADLLEDERYRPAGLFFLNDIYAPRDFSQRDHDIERLHDFLARVFPPQMLQLLTDIVALNALSNDLDRRLAQALAELPGEQEEITPERYAEGYRKCDNYAERIRQIELILQVLRIAGEGAQSRVLGAAIKLARGPAHKAGWVELYEYLEHGHAAFKGMREVKTFVSTIEQREKRILDRIFWEHPEPFNI